VVATDGHPALGGAGQPRKHGNECGFAGAVGAQQAKELPVLDRQADIGERLKTLAAAAAEQAIAPAYWRRINLGEILDGNSGHSRGERSAEPTIIGRRARPPRLTP